MEIELYTALTAANVPEDRARTAVQAMDAAMERKLDYGLEGLRKDMVSGQDALRKDMLAMEQRLDQKIDSLAREIGYMKWYMVSAIPATALILGLLNYIK